MNINVYNCVSFSHLHTHTLFLLCVAHKDEYKVLLFPGLRIVYVCVYERALCVSKKKIQMPYYTHTHKTFLGHIVLSIVWRGAATLCDETTYAKRNL